MELCNKDKDDILGIVDIELKDQHGDITGDSTGSSSSAKTTMSKISVESIYKKFIKKKFKQKNPDVADIEYHVSRVYGFKVKGLLVKDYERLKEELHDKYDIEIQYNHSFNILLFKYFEYHINIVKTEINKVNEMIYCVKKDSLYDFSENTKECYSVLKPQLKIIDEGIYELSTVSF